MEIKRATKQNAIARIEKEEPHPNHFVWWNNISSEEVDLYKKTLDEAKEERDMQIFFENHPLFLIQHLGGGHGRWCIPQKKLGSEYVPDFIIGEKSSIGYEWYALEIESPKHRLFNNKGNPSAKLIQAMAQIIDWRGWLEDNIDYAKRSTDENGLGLRGISGNLASYIIIGRRDNIGNEKSKWRKYMKDHLNIHIHTYDWLTENASHRINCSER